MAEKALAGLRILECCQMVAGPYCAKLLGDLGAEVVKVESPGAGDESRARGPFPGDVPHGEKSGLFLFLNTNKLGVTLDVSSPDGRKILSELVKSADVLVIDAPPQEVQRLGMEYSSLRELNPGLILVSVTPFGITGPYRDYKAYPLNTFNAGGEAFMTPATTPFMERPPLKLANYAGEFMCGISAAGATLCAYFHKLRTGEGQSIDISRQEALMFVNMDELQRYPAFGAVTNRQTRGVPVGGVLQCKDGYVAFTPMRREHWSAFFGIIQGPESRNDERLTDLDYLEAHHRELKDIAHEFLMKRTRQEIFSSPLARLCPLGPCYSVDEVVDSAQMRFRHFFVEIEHPVAGKLRYPSAPYKFSQTPWQAERPAPCLGEHNEEVYCGRLGYSREDLVKLRELGVV